MSDSAKRILLIAVVVVAVGVAIYSGTRSMSAPKEDVVGTLPMPEGGGRDAEKGPQPNTPTGGMTPGTDAATGEAVADQASGMPADMVNPP